MSTNHPISRTDTWKVDFVNELDSRWFIRILVTAVHFESIDSIFVNALCKQESTMEGAQDKGLGHTCGGPRIVPFQLAINISSPSARPYEHASLQQIRY
jgi:hypothetical protein